LLIADLRTLTLLPLFDGYEKDRPVPRIKISNQQSKINNFNPRFSNPAPPLKLKPPTAMASCVKSTYPALARERFCEYH
jgi:hypothetical protein